MSPKRLPSSTIPVDALLQAAPDAMLVVDIAGRIVLANPEAERLFGYSVDELLHESVDALVPEAIRGIHSGHRAGYAAAPRRRPMGAGVELVARRRDGTEVPVEISLSPLAIGDQHVVIAAIRDVTERRRAQALSARARQQEAIVELGRLALAGTSVTALMPIAAQMATATLKGVCGYVVEHTADDRLIVRGAAGWAAEPGLSFPDSPESSQAAYALSRGEPVVSAAHEAEPRFGTAEPLRQAGAASGVCVVVGGRARPFGVLGVHAHEIREATPEDVRFLQAMANVVAAATERERTESRLRESQEQLSSIIDSTPAIIFIKDDQGRYRLGNRRFQQIFGVDAESLNGKTDFDLLPYHEAVSVRANDHEVLRANQPLELEEVIDHPDGPHTYISLKFPLRDAQGRPHRVGAVCTDVTERRDLYARLNQAQRLETVGQLAGGVAHDFNNLLAVVRNYAGFVLDDLGSAHPSADDLVQIQRATERAAELTRQLLIVGRRELAEPELINLNEVVADIEPLLRRTLPERIILTIRLDDDIPQVLIDPGQIEQVVLNLALNARDAMPDGGELVLATRATRNESERRVELIVVDDGAGMAPEVMEHVFEPFFTTKPPGEGTGLGLATAHSVVERAAGQIAIDSKPGRGTSVIITLPGVAGELSDVDPEAVEELPRGNSEVVLVVEDEPAVRSLIVRILRTRGYEVREAANGDEALRIAGSTVGFDVLLSDVVMPGISGPELAARLRTDRPELPVVLMSGYADDQTARSGDLGGVLTKPFGPGELLRALRRALSPQ